MSEAPLHVQVIELLERRITARREQHRAKAGDGLPDQDYQRMVGRIKEATVFLEELTRVKHESLGEIEDDEEEESEQKPARRNRRARS